MFIEKVLLKPLMESIVRVDSLQQPYFVDDKLLSMNRKADLVTHQSKHSQIIINTTISAHKSSIFALNSHSDSQNNDYRAICKAFFRYWKRRSNSRTKLWGISASHYTHMRILR